MTDTVANKVERNVDVNDLFNLSLQLAMRVYAHDVKPTWVVGLWRGGVLPAVVTQGYLEYRGIHTEHVPIRTRSYHPDGTQQPVVKVYGLNRIIDHANQHDVLLLVDDIFDSGRSIEAVIRKLRKKMRANMPKTVIVATLFYKPDNNKTSPRLVPDIVCETTDAWLVFPHEFSDLGTSEKIRRVMGDQIADLIQSQDDAVQQVTPESQKQRASVTLPDDTPSSYPLKVSESAANLVTTTITKFIDHYTTDPVNRNVFGFQITEEAAKAIRAILPENSHDLPIMRRDELTRQQHWAKFLLDHIRDQENYVLPPTANETMLLLLVLQVVALVPNPYI